MTTHLVYFTIFHIANGLVLSHCCSAYQFNCIFKSYGSQNAPSSSIQNLMLSIISTERTMQFSPHPNFLTHTKAWQRTIGRETTDRWVEVSSSGGLQRFSKFTSNAYPTGHSKIYLSLDSDNPDL